MDFTTCAKAAVFTTTGFVSSMLTHFFGGFDTLLQALVVFMAIDIISGWLAAVLKRSNKSSTGRLSSTAGFYGLIKKGCILLIIIVAVYLDILLGTSGVTRDAAIIAFILNELLSILENMGKIGIKIPAPIADVLDVLNKKDK